MVTGGALADLNGIVARFQIELLLVATRAHARLEQRTHCAILHASRQVEIPPCIMVRIICTIIMCFPSLRCTMDG
jgi:hypothetical protein